MPRHTMDYSKTIIYKIVCNDLNITETYVGHTTNFVKRKYSHNKTCNEKKQKAYNLKVYQTIRENGGWNNWSMIQICQYPCNTIHEAILEERRHYELLNASLNMDYPGRTQKEYRKDNKEQILEKSKIYFEKHKEQKLEYNKKYYDEKQNTVLEHKKEYYQKNRTILLEKAKTYRNKKKEDKDLSFISITSDNMDKPKKTFPCEICSEIFTTKQNLQRHQSRKHTNISETIQDDNISVLSESTKSETNPMDSPIGGFERSVLANDPQTGKYLLDVPDVPKPEPIPSDEYLINLRNEYMKYQHLYTGIDNRIKWNENNSNVDLNYHLRKHNHKFTYILTDIKDLYGKAIDG